MPAWSSASSCSLRTTWARRCSAQVSIAPSPALRSEILEPGQNIEEMIRLSAARGDYGDVDPDEKLREFCAMTSSPENHFRERNMPDGRTLQVRGVARPGGGFIATYIDVTEARSREQEVAQHSALLGSALNAMTQGLVAYDSDLTILAANKKIGEILGVPAEMMERRSKT